MLNMSGCFLISTFKNAHHIKTQEKEKIEIWWICLRAQKVTKYNWWINIYILFFILDVNALNFTNFVECRLQHIVISQALMFLQNVDFTDFADLALVAQVATCCHFSGINVSQKRWFHWFCWFGSSCTGCNILSFLKH